MCGHDRWYREYCAREHGLSQKIPARLGVAHLHHLLPIFRH
jgi:hypothetical protein